MMHKLFLGILAKRMCKWYVHDTMVLGWLILYEPNVRVFQHFAARLLILLVSQHFLLFSVQFLCCTKYRDTLTLRNWLHYPFHLVSGVLTHHPARKFVMDFLRMIVVDSLSMPQSSKSAPVIDLILEVIK